MLERLAEKYFQLNLGGQIFTSFTEFALYKTKSNTEVKFWTNMLETTWSCDSFDTVFIEPEHPSVSISFVLRKLLFC